MPDSQLKAAAEEIKAILRKHDIAALITLQGPKSIVFVREISPSWSCAKIEQTRDGARVIRDALIRIQGGFCYICGGKIDVTASVSDHIILWSKGGKTSPVNLRATCAPCNLKRPKR